MTSLTDRTRAMFSIEIDLGDHFESATTRVLHEGHAVKVYERSSPRSLLADSIRFMIAERVMQLEVRFRGATYLWLPGAYQLTLDAFRFLACLEQENLSVTSALDAGCGCGVIGVGLAHLAAPRRLQLLDVNMEVLANAEANTAQIGDETAVELRHAEFSPSALEERFDVIVSNPPYFPSGAIAVPAGRVTMTDEFNLTEALIRGFEARTNLLYFTFSEVLGTEIREAVDAAGFSDYFEVVDSWEAPIPRSIVSDLLEDRFDVILGNQDELRHRVSVGRLRQ
ncbi:MULTISPECIES: methyltransferase [unclassified Microbacterium]|uniref:methyltransferase n=1 Tax=unclassified Microbacterium TaxID=2609290 RepID=UPI0016054088|nr:MULTISPECIES: methyltransferase [unclassified Microbacterium]QNA91329.1 methyltransferase [Microbacterium sp. Se63.02b]QYM64488.1 methyltransferase [Microbacterium sp. Se5.02b]